MTARSLVGVACGVAAGAFVWTATEYVTHRWVFHGPHRRFGRVHRAHHRDPECSSAPARLAGHLAVAGATAAAASAASAMLPGFFVWSVAAAFAGGYSTYEINHWNFHHRPARTARGQLLRDRHHQHHFGAPRSNLGVTMTFWDSVFGTEAAR